ncbi:hypothetical protein [Oceaniglobus indicus]|uniref:hypothetical protein n=1 Tax=Oceaniglobus indicus TaxID=2047749 RepID=UPI000C195E9F|nr:hypothetical protein [Oceaniglobus indicus]
MRRRVVLPRALLWGIAMLTLGAAVLGFSLGRDAAEMTETQVISVYAKRYAAETGRPLTDCIAVPGQGRVWLVVRCGSGERQRVYPVARDGRLAPTALPDA